MSYFNHNQDLFDETLLNLYDEQFKYSTFKTLISNKNNEANKLMNHIFESIGQEEDDDVKFVVDLSDEMKEQYKQGLLKFDKGKDGKLYAQLRDENNRYGKKLNIKEDIKESDLIFASQLDRELKCSQFPSCVDFTGFNCIQNCVYCYYLSFFSKIALKHRPHYFHI